MKRIDPIRQIQILREYLTYYRIYVRQKCEDDVESEKPFDLFSSPVKDVTLKKKDVLKFVEDLDEKLEDLWRDFSNAGVKYADSDKLNSEFANFIIKRREKLHDRTVKMLDFLNRTHESIKTVVRKDILKDFNKLYSKVNSKVFSTIKKGSNGGFTSIELTNYIESEIECFPQHRIKDYFDENATLIQIGEIPFDTDLKIRESLLKDEDGDSLFVFQWQRNTDGNIIILRMRIGNSNKWYNLFIDDDSYKNKL